MHGSVGGMIDVWTASMETRGFSKVSLKDYRERLERFTRYLDGLGIERIQDVSAKDLIDYRLSMIDDDLSASSIETHLRAIRLFFGFLEKEGLIFLNPAQNLKMPRSPRTILHVPSEADMVRLLDQPDKNTSVGIRDKAMLEVMYSCGARLSEIIQMNVTDLMLNEGMIKLFGKGSKDRIVPLGKHAVKWLKTYLNKARNDLLANNKDEPALWISYTTNSRMKKNAIQKMTAKYSEQAELTTSINPHSIRRACATHLLENGADPIIIAEMLGHATLKTLGKYLRVSVAEIKRIHSQSKVGQ